MLLDVNIDLTEYPDIDCEAEQDWITVKDLVGNKPLETNLNTKSNLPDYAPHE